VNGNKEVLEDADCVGQQRFRHQYGSGAVIGKSVRETVNVGMILISMFQTQNVSKLNDLQIGVTLITVAS